MATIEIMQPIPPNSNPYLVDLFRMGCNAGNEQKEPNQEEYMPSFFSIMWGLENDELIVIFNPTGERVRVSFNESREEFVKVFATEGLRNQTSDVGQVVQDYEEHKLCPRCFCKYEEREGKSKTPSVYGSAGSEALCNKCDEEVTK